MTNTNLPDFQTLVQTDSQLRAFAFFSANLRQLMPEIPYKVHTDLFAEAAAYAALADTLDGVPLDDVFNVMGGSELLNGDRPGIIATYHTGPYRLLGQWLASQGKPLTLVVSSDVAAKQGDCFSAWYAQCTKGSAGDKLECLLAEDPMIFRKMIRALQRGRYLLMYVDGQTGVKQQAGGSGSLSLDFLESALWVRTGVADLARLAKVPIYPLIAYFNETDQPTIQCLPTLVLHEEYASRYEWAKHCMNTLYQHLETTVCQHPAQWEGWLYIHHDLVVEPNLGQGGLLQYYMPFALHDRYFLLEKERLAAYPISDLLYARLRAGYFG